MVDCSVILYNMTIKSQRNSFTFTDLYEWEEDVVMDKAMDNNVEPIFIEENNQVDIGVAALLARRVSHMSSSVEYQEKHVGLRNGIIEHIITNDQYKRHMVIILLI